MTNFIITKNITPYIILSSESILRALQKIDLNTEGMLICVDDTGVLLGILTDGDLRRRLIDNPRLNLDTSVHAVINKRVACGNIKNSLDKNLSLLSNRISFLPLIDDNGRLIALLKNQQDYLLLDNKRIGQGYPCYVIAEIGNNHNGNFELAVQLVNLAKEAGADCAKFQMRDLKQLYVNGGNPTDASEDLGSQYTLDLLSRFQLSNDEMFRIFDHCNKIGITPLCTPWDIPSAKILDQYGLAAFKTASADLVNHDLLRAIAKTGKPIITSTGMSTDAEISEAIQLLRGAGSQFALLHCNSTYPAPLKDINLNYMKVLRELGSCPVGYSSHDRGIYASIAAVALGANIIEKHFTVDRSMEGNDHRVSLLPEEFKEMTNAIRQVQESIGQGGSRRVSQGELMNRESLGKSLTINQRLNKGEVITAQMLEIRSPGKGLQPNRKNDVVGKPAKRQLNAGDILYPSDIGEGIVEIRSYSFNRKFGIPVRYHDLSDLARKSNFDLLEFHLSYMDLDIHLEDYFHSDQYGDLVVHAPELFKGEHILDLCSLDSEYRNLSISYLKEVIEVTKKIKKWFPQSQKPRIVINAGGFTQDAPLEKSEKKLRYQLVEESLGKLKDPDVQIIPQTMPPFPWHFGGQRFQNLFVDANETADFCTRNNMQICLDISHSKLACNHYGWSFSEFLQKIGLHVSHMHVADAAGVDGEGLQVGAGDIDFFSMANILNKYAPDASFIPEVWQGHKDSGAGFFIALERLEQFFGR
jgi:sialic acid synthase SpsE/sugar phosphate isomerase/epimerase